MILLARHGETDDNRPPVRVQGHTDVPLNERGREQARALGEQVAQNAIASLYCSHLSRAHETAQIVGEVIDLEPRVDQRFAETDRGAWEGLTWEEVKHRDPAGYAAWLAAGADFRFPGGESLGEQLERVSAALEDVAGAGELPALVVCHGGTIRVALSRENPRGLRAFHDPDVPNGAVFEL
ncbi:MAG: 2,3-bisphosphoglycerate-dependent phosphoglycerate mutase [Solirubrobacteraceae bacterium]|jgi:broad specificity phosphatase PhoE|nr:2,3-bisphosphoglycerate-dependent phosphoglycerate mutase [Solirubrobacteraceae bacterium]